MKLDNAIPKVYRRDVMKLDNAIPKVYRRDVMKLDNAIPKVYRRDVMKLDNAIPKVYRRDVMKLDNAILKSLICRNMFYNDYIFHGWCSECIHTNLTPERMWFNNSRDKEVKRRSD